MDLDVLLFWWRSADDDITFSPKQESIKVHIIIIEYKE